MHILKSSDTQTSKEIIQEMERPLGVPKVEDMNYSPCWYGSLPEDVPRAQEWHQPKQSQQRCGGCGESAHASIYDDSNIHHDALEHVYVPGDFLRIQIQA